MLKEFREFIMKGNVMDMAVGIILGVAFGGIVNSLVKDVLMPPIGLALGKVDFSSLFINLGGGTYANLAEAEKAGAPVIKYGLFLNTIINFLIISFIVFLIVKAVNKLRREEVTTKDCPFCTSTIALGATRCPQCTSEIPAA